MRKIKVAFISDIHGNSVALKAILNDAKKNNVSEYVFMGDQINDLPFGNETLEIVKKYSKNVLKGNKEQYLIEYDLNKELYNWKNIQFQNTIFMYNELSKENLEYIKKLPHKLDLEFEGVKVLAVHGSPERVEEQLHHNNVELLDKYTKDLDADILIFGHTHEMMWYENINGKHVINAGVAGVSPCYEHKCEYVIIEFEKGKIVNIELKLVDYDITQLIEKVKKCGILDVDKVFMNITFCSITGNGEARYKFLKEAQKLAKEKGRELYRQEAKGIFTYFKLYDDDIWLDLAEKYKEYFIFK